MMKTDVRERPILFSGPMVRAILDGRKTQTRRIIKPQPFKAGDEWSSRTVTQAWNSGFVDVDCPYGNTGHRLWVRETFGRIPDCEGIIYRADGPHDGVREWRPSIFMPRLASRITLEVVGVRVERLQEISEEDAKAEGAEHMATWADAERGHPTQPHRIAFLWAFAKMHKLEVGIDNPWLWVIEFKRVGQNA